MTNSGMGIYIYIYIYIYGIFVIFIGLLLSVTVLFADGGVGISSAMYVTLPLYKYTKPIIF